MSKTLAEKAAWEFAEKHGVDVVAIHPATCLGPLMQPYLNASCAVLQQLLQGSKDTQEYHWLGAVHVKDVVKAQVLLFESPAASGRYLCTNGIYQFGDFAERVSKLFPEFPVHRFVFQSPLRFILWLAIILPHEKKWCLLSSRMMQSLVTVIPNDKGKKKKKALENYWH